MTKKKILVVFGTRPEAIKMAPLVVSLRAELGFFDVSVCVTAQHRQMLDQVLEWFSIQPDVDLDLMAPGQDLFDLTSRILLSMRNALRQEKPNVVLVHGDTTTAFATALACFYEGIPVGHVEAGLRTYDLAKPFPEEMNRQFVGKVAHWHFSPTLLSKRNLLKEGVSEDSILVTGNTVIDALKATLRKIKADVQVQDRLRGVLMCALGFDFEALPFVLITGHRRENFGEGFIEICEAIASLSREFPQIHFVYPVHLNPNVQDPVYRILGGLFNVHLVEPFGYAEFSYLLSHAHLVLTDSGGIQEEAPSLGKPVLVMRDSTERPEAVEAGTVLLVGAHREKIIKEMRRLLSDSQAYASMARAENPYGDGKAAQRIVEFLKQAT